MWRSSSDRIENDFFGRESRPRPNAKKFHAYVCASRSIFTILYAERVFRNSPDHEDTTRERVARMLHFVFDLYFYGRFEISLF